MMKAKKALKDIERASQRSEIGNQSLSLNLNGLSKGDFSRDISPVNF